MRSFLAALTRHPLSLTGAAITTASAVMIIVLFSIEMVGHHGSPYIGILSYMVFPAIFVLGLLMIPFGVRRARKAEAAGGETGFPVIDLNRGRTRRFVLIFLAATLVNVVILAVATFKGVEVMETTEFCGTTCHTVMQPEHTAYLRSPHARVRCVECHIGPGASWFVKSKLSGAWQVVAVAFDLYPRPIPTPIENLRPARDTCEQCHWPVKFVGDRLEVITHYANDEANTELKSVLLLRIGGIRAGVSQGIHWHVDPGIKIRYRADESRMTIYDVELTRADGSVKLYRGDEVEESEKGPWREMDCIDCHNRPTHVYQSPEEAVDLAIQSGSIDRALPYVRREGLAAIQRDYADHEEARTGIQAALRTFYEQSYPELAAGNTAQIDRAGEALGDIYAGNVFPAMNVTWGTYPDHLGHNDYPGCFRCHNDEHTTDDGEVISQDCFTCHSLLAMEEESPEIIDMLQP
jgi:hypothetical protein